MKLLLSIGMYISILGISSCGGSGKNNDDDDDTSVRLGEELVLEELKFYDGKPDISADGGQMVFISGRDKSLRVYKVDLAADGAVTRVTDDSDKTTEELDGVITPDGQWVVITATSSNGVDLFIKDFAGTKSAQKVSDDSDASESNVTVSHDSSIFAFVRRSSSSNGSKIFAAQLDGSGLVDEPVQISDENDDEDMPIWIPGSAAGVYTLITRHRNEGNLEKTFLIRQIDTNAGIEVSDAKPVTVPVEVDDSLNFTANTNGLIFVGRNPSSGDLAASNVKPVGTFKTDATLTVANAPYFLNTSNEDVTKPKAAGISVRMISHAHAAVGAGVWLATEAYTCSKDLAYGSTLLLYSGATNRVTRFFPESKDEGKTFVFRDGPCADPDRKETYNADRNLVSAKISANSTIDDFQVVYVSIFTGDNEVYLLKSVNGEKSIENLSANITEK